MQHSFYSLYSLAALAVHSSSLVAPAPPSPHADQLQGGSKKGDKVGRWGEGETCSHLPFIGQLFKRRTRKTFTDKRRKLWTRLWAPLSSQSSHPRLCLLRFLLLRLLLLVKFLVAVIYVLLILKVIY